MRTEGEWAQGEARVVRRTVKRLELDQQSVRDKKTAPLPLMLAPK